MTLRRLPKEVQAEIDAAAQALKTPIQRRDERIEKFVAGDEYMQEALQNTGKPEEMAKAALAVAKSLARDPEYVKLEAANMKDRSKEGERIAYANAKIEEAGLPKGLHAAIRRSLTQTYEAPSATEAAPPPPARGASAAR